MKKLLILTFLLSPFLTFANNAYLPCEEDFSKIVENESKVIWKVLLFENGAILDDLVNGTIKSEEEYHQAVYKDVLGYECIDDYYTDMAIMEEEYTSYIDDNNLNELYAVNELNIIKANAILNYVDQSTENPYLEICNTAYSVCLTGCSDSPWGNTWIGAANFLFLSQCYGGCLIDVTACTVEAHGRWLRERPQFQDN